MSTSWSRSEFRRIDTRCVRSPNFVANQMHERVSETYIGFETDGYRGPSGNKLREPNFATFQVLRPWQKWVARKADYSPDRRQALSSRPLVIRPFDHFGTRVHEDKIVPSTAVKYWNRVFARRLPTPPLGGVRCAQSRAERIDGISAHDLGDDFPVI